MTQASQLEHHTVRRTCLDTALNTQNLEGALVCRTFCTLRITGRDDRGKKQAKRPQHSTPSCVIRNNAHGLNDCSFFVSLYKEPMP
jgi:hypothetical protein